MKIAGRVIILIYTLLFTFLSLGVTLISLRLIPLDLVLTDIAKIEGNLEIGLVGAVFFLAGIGSLLKNLFSNRQRESLVHYSELGDVKISLAAIEDLIEKTTGNINGIRNVKVNVFFADAKSQKMLMTTIKAAISPEVNIPTVTADMQNRIRECVKETVGVEIDKIEIIVETISSNFKAKHKVR